VTSVVPIEDATDAMPRLSKKEFSGRLQEVCDGGDYKAAQRLLEKELKNSPEDHWLLAELSSAYYEQYRYEQARRLAIRALRLAPRCPLALWHYAGALFMLKQYDNALTVFRRIVRRGVERVAYGPCGEGERWAKSLVNDSRAKIGKCYARKGDYRYGLRWSEAHLSHRAPGIPSVYSREEIVSYARWLRAMIAYADRPKMKKAKPKET